MKGMRVAGVKTIEQANRYLSEDYLVWWERELTVEAANSDDAHRRLEQSHNLAASPSHVEARQIRNDYTFRWDARSEGESREAAGRFNRCALGRRVSADGTMRGGGEGKSAVSAKACKGAPRRSSHQQMEQ